MKTIFITSFAPFIPRNILKTAILKKLSELGDLRIIIFAPHYKMPYFLKEFGGGNLVIEGVSMSAKESGAASLVFRRIARMMLDTRTARIQKRAKLFHDKKFLYFFVSRLVSVLGKIYFIRQSVRFLDYLFSKRRFQAQFERFRPDVIFSTDVQNEYDARMLQQAKRRGALSIGMVRSWDNLTSLQGVMRAIPDWLLVHTEILKKEAVDFHDVPEDKIKVVGKPHYDTYLKRSRTPREVFFKDIGLDPSKKLIFFAPWGGKFENNTGADEYVLNILEEASNKFDLNILVRPNPTHLFNWVPPDNSKRMVLDRAGVVFSEKQVADREMGQEDDLRLSDALYHCDLAVSCSSTVVVDAALFNKPIIATALTPHKTPYYAGVLKYYDYNHFANIVKTGGIRIAETKAQLMKFIEMYLQNPALDQNGRERIREDQCWKLDGKSAERVAEFIVSVLKV